MKTNRRELVMKYLVIASAALAAALFVAACGGTSSPSSSGGSGTTASSGSNGGYGYGAGASRSTTTQASGSKATIAVKSTSLGRILVDGKGMTIYLFEKDKGTTSTCNGECATFWPPVTTNGAAMAGTGITAGKLGTTMRSDGTTEVTYNGHPLYYYAGDQKAGDVNGQGLNVYGALWYVLSPRGEAIVG